MLTHRHMAQLLAPDRLVPGRCRDVDVLLAWGRRPSALRVERLARRWDLPVWHLEDGLLRSVAKGGIIHPLLCWWMRWACTSMQRSPAGWSS